MSARISKETDGTYTIIGSAIAANAHTCSLGGSGIFFDDNTGWFSLSSSEGKPVPLFQIFDDRLTIIDNGKPAPSDFGDTSGFVSCGARASFSEMTRLRYDENRLETLLTFPDK